MGVYSTVDVTREYALKKVKEKLEDIDNAELADFLFEAIGEETLHNYIVWDSEEEIKIHRKKE